jgi:hypothetical protein
MIVYALVLNYLRGGPARVKGWISAKFINKPYGPGGGASSPPTSRAAGAGAFDLGAIVAERAKAKS